MLTLAFECNSLNLWVGLLQDNQLIQQSQINNGFTHSEMLVVKIEEILKENKIWYQDLDLIVVGNGPSSFTAIRVALSVAKMINISCQKPVVTVNKCEVLTFFYNKNLFLKNNVSSQLKVTTIVNACGNEVFFARYCLENQSFKCLEQPSLTSVEGLIEQLKNRQDFLIFDQQISHDHFGDKVTNQFLILQNDAYDLGLLGLEKYGNFSKTKSMSEILPIYLLEPRISKRK